MIQLSVGLTAGWDLPNWTRYVKTLLDDDDFCGCAGAGALRPPGPFVAPLVPRCALTSAPSPCEGLLGTPRHAKHPNVTGRRHLGPPHRCAPSFLQRTICTGAGGSVPKTLCSAAGR